jgi:hypothetical protein
MCKYGHATQARMSRTPGVEAKEEGVVVTSPHIIQVLNSAGSDASAGAEQRMADRRPWPSRSITL